ncbi:MAG: VWD domain-containing protein, partial [Candidatus Accumulibacter sp.]|nr:VWD domain-containing protein [Accumulibacter sp.]
KTITLDVTDDLVAEGTENFTVTLSDPTNAVLTRAVATGTIRDDDRVTLSIADATVTEGDPGGTNATIEFTVRRTGDNGTASTVIYTATPGTATSPDDYNGSLDPLSGTLTFAAGETSKTITLDVTDDLVAEGTENFTVTLSDPTNAVLTRAVATGTIRDDDPTLPTLPTLSVADATAIEGDALVFVVSVDKADPISPITATYTINFEPPAIGFADQSDLAPPTPLTGTVSIPAGQASVSISVGTFDDLLIEGSETFTLTLSNLSANAQAGDLQASGTIVDNEKVECGYSWGDPHYVTADGLAYDMQSCGEFVFVETSKANDPMPVTVQTRTALYGPNASVNTAVATLVDGHRVTINTLEDQPLRVDGQITTLSSGNAISLGAGQIHYTSGVYSVVYPSQERLIVSDHGSYIDVRFCASASRPDGSLRGLLGNFDGNAANDLATRGGTVFSPTISFSDLYGSFANSWRISQAESLFDYRPGESTASFTGPDCPSSATSLHLVNPDCAAEATSFLDAAHVTDPTLRAAAILDYGLTCNSEFLQSVLTIETPQQTAKIIDPLIIWQNGGQVVIGSEGARTTFSVGTNALAPAGVNWTGLTSSDNWSAPGNWLPTSPPAADQVAIFAAADTGGTDLVDENFD